MASVAPIWTLLDDRPGNRGQVEAVAAAIGRDRVAIEIGYGPLATLPSTILRGRPWHLRAQARRALEAAGAKAAPALILSAGRRGALSALYAKKRFGGKIAQLMWPGFADGLDLIATPAHDRSAPRDRGLLFTLGAPHGLDRAALDREAEVWRARYDALERPRIALLVGGQSKRAPFGPGEAFDLGLAASTMARDAGGSLMATTSRRTGSDATEALRRALSEGAAPFDLHDWASADPNPYRGVLGLADAVIVTADSASMASEAAATGRAIYLFRSKKARADKLGALHDALRAERRLFDLGAVYRAMEAPPIDAAAEIARAARALLSH